MSLALGRPLRPKRKSRRSLLDTALWYPSIPPENLRITDGFSVGQSPTTSRHSLLFWVWLGGPGGSYLQYLTGISGTRFKGGLGGIEFHFSTDSVPITSGSWVFVMTRKGRISPLMVRGESTSRSSMGSFRRCLTFRFWWCVRNKFYGC